MTTDSPPQTRPSVSPAADATTRRRSRLRERSPLLNPAPIVGATLAAFALAFGGLTMRLATGRDPALGPVASVTQTASAGGARTLSTRPSGAAATVAGATAGANQATASLVTSTSGSAGEVAGGNAARGD